MRHLAILLALMIALPAHALAEPVVVTSIAPVHSLTARIMQGVGEPHLLLPPGASPHDQALRPSDAKALARATVIFQVNPELEPWLQRPIASLAANSTVVTLAQTPGLTRLSYREGAAFADHDRNHGEDNNARTGAIDPHMWLDPENAKLWLLAISAALGEADPPNSELYAANARAAGAELDRLSAEISTILAPVRNRPFVVLHDAFHYFERRFDIEATGAIAVSDARAPGPARIAEIRAHIRATNAVCVFAEPQLRAQLTDTVTQGTNARRGVIDPLGFGLQPGPDLYPTLLRNIANGLRDCLI